MLFKDYHIWPMYIGLKTYTRRLWKRPHVKVGGSYDVTHIMMYSPEDVVGTIVVEDLYRQPLGMMTAVDAMCEGGYSLKQYYDVLANIHKKNGGGPASFLIDIPYVVKFRFSLSDLVDGNGGTENIELYHQVWIEHMKGIGLTDKEIRDLDKCTEGK